MTLPIQSLTNAPAEFLKDPTTHKLMEHAVTLVPCGHTLDKESVEKLAGPQKICPLDKRPIDLWVPNHAIQQILNAHKQSLSQAPI
jgi:hypothetical protein